MIINYTKSGSAYSDFVAENTVLTRYKEGARKINTSTSTIGDAARMLVAEGKIPCDDIVLQFEGKFLGSPNKYGTFRNWPEGFCDIPAKMAQRILSGAVSFFQGLKQVHFFPSKEEAPLAGRQMDSEYRAWQAETLKVNKPEGNG